MFNLLVEIEDLFSKEIIKSEYTYKFYELSDIPVLHIGHTGNLPL